MKKVKDKNKVIESKSKKNLIGSIIFLVLTIIILILASRTIIELFEEPSEVFVVEEGTLSLTETADAYIIRSETVLQGENYKNGMEKTKSEGKKVSKGETVFRYLVNGESKLKENIDKLNQEILEAQDSELLNSSADVQNIKKEIKVLLTNMSKTNNIEELQKYKKEISECNSKITSILGTHSKKGSYLKELIDEKEKYEDELYDNAEIIKASQSGIVSYKVDGYENIFKTDNFDYLNKEFLDSLDLKAGEMIESSDEKGKLITSFETYLATVLSSDAAKEAKVGDKVKITIGTNNTVDAQVKEIKEEGENERLIVFKMINLSEDLIDFRKISIDVIWWSRQGLKVPNSSLIKEGDLNYVIRNRAGYDVKILVKVLRTNGVYSLVDNYSSSELFDMGYDADTVRNMYTIKLYDKIKTNP